MKDIPSYEYLVEAAKDIPGMDAFATHTCLMIAHAFDEMQKLKNAQFTQAGITKGRFMLMLSLYKLPKSNEHMARTPADLADDLQVARATITGLVDSLEKDGYVSRERCECDRRNVYICLTQAGKAYMDNFLPNHSRLVVELMRGLSKAEQETLVHLLQKLVGGLPAVDEVETF